jgi:glutamate carboxypeptidase
MKDLGYRGYGELVLYFDAEEETGSAFGEQIIARLARQADACLVMDTARPNWGIVAKRKGYATYQIDVKGLSGHAGNAPHHSASATMELGHVITELYKLASPFPGNPTGYTEEALARRHVPDRGQFIPANTINVGVVSTPNTKRNVIPDADTAQVEVRCFELSELKRLDQAIKALKPKVLGTSITVKGGIVVGPEQKTPKVQRLIDTYKRVAKQAYGATVTEWLAGGISDGNVAAQYTPTIDALGVEEHDEHTPREWVDLKTAAPRTVTLVKYIQALCEP